MNSLDESSRTVALLISNVLFRASVLGFGLLAVSCIPVLFMTDQIYEIHNGLIEIPRPQYNAMLFAWLGHLKIAVLVLFLLPAIAIRWTVSKTPS